MNTSVQIEYNGIQIEGEILHRSEWDYDVRIIRPIVSYKSGTYIPTFARSQTRKNYLSEYGDNAIIETLKELWVNNCIIRTNWSSIVKSYNIYQTQIQKNKTDNEINSIQNDFMDSIFGIGKWSISDLRGLMEMLESDDLEKSKQFDTFKQ